MRKTFLTLSLALASTAGLWAQSATEAIVTATVNGIPDGTNIVATLASTHKTEKPVATGVVKGGKVTLTLPVTEVRYFGFGTKAAPYTFFVLTKGGENVAVSVDTKPYNSEKGLGYSGDNVKVTGSASHNEYEQKVGQMKDRLEQLYKDYHERHKAMLDADAEAWKAKDSLKQKVIRQSAEFKEFEKEETEFFATVESSYKKAISDNKDTWWGPFIMLNTYSYFTEDNKKEWAMFSDAAKNSFYGQLLGEQVNPKGFTGESLPQFDLLQADGTKSPMASAVAGKKYYLVDFWASWCGPCRKEIPNLKALYSKYKDSGLQIVSVSIDKDEAAWKKALNEEQLPWPNGLDRDGISDAYKVRFIPAIFLVDGATGKCIAENIRGEQLATKLAELFEAK